MFYVYFKILAHKALIGPLYSILHIDTKLSFCQPHLTIFGQMAEVNHNLKFKSFKVSICLDLIFFLGLLCKISCHIFKFADSRVNDYEWVIVERWPYLFVFIYILFINQVCISNYACEPFSQKPLKFLQICK